MLRTDLRRPCVLRRPLLLRSFLLLQSEMQEAEVLQTEVLQAELLRVHLRRSCLCACLCRPGLRADLRCRSFLRLRIVLLQ